LEIQGLGWIMANHSAKGPKIENIGLGLYQHEISDREIIGKIGILDKMPQL
jgi:hypothetical protein